MRLTTLAPIVPVNSISHLRPQTQESPVAIDMTTTTGKGQISITDHMDICFYLWEDVSGPITSFKAGESDTWKRLSACDNRMISAMLNVHLPSEHRFS